MLKNKIITEAAERIRMVCFEIIFSIKMNSSLVHINIVFQFLFELVKATFRVKSRFTDYFYDVALCISPL